MNDLESPIASLAVARDDSTVLVRVIGLGNMHISLTLKDFVKSEIAEGYVHFVLDFSACRGLDSTFMGTLIALNGRINEQEGWLCLVNVGGECEKQLKLLGIWGLLPVCAGIDLKPVETECLLPGGDAARRLELIHQAHEHLVGIDERNQERFGTFLGELAAELGLPDTADSLESSPPASAPAPVNKPSDTQVLDRLRRIARDASAPDAPESAAETGEGGDDTNK